MKDLDRFSAGIQKKYLIAFLILIFFGITGQILQQSYLSNQKAYSQIINKAGKQRMYSQRLARNILLELPAREIQASFTKLKKAHQSLKNGTKSLPKAFNTDIYNRYVELDLIIEQIEDALRCFEQPCKVVSQVKKSLISLTDSFLFKMDIIVDESSDYVQKEVQRLRFIELGVFFFIFFALIYQIRTTIYPIKNLLIDKIKGYEFEKAKSEKIEEAAKMGIWELDVQTGQTTWSKEVYRIYELNQGINLDRAEATKFFTDRDQKRITSYMDDAINKKRSFDEQFEFIDAKGNKKWVRAIGEPLYQNKTQTVNKLIGLFQDITKAKQQEESIVNSSEVFKLAVEGAKVGIWKWDLSSDTVHFDKTWCELHGLNYKEVKMELETWRSRVHPADIERCYDDLKNYMKRKNESFENIHRVRHEDGNWIYILARGKFINFDKDGRARRFIGTCQNITDTIKSQNEQKLILSSLKLGVWKWNIIDNDLQWDESLYSLYGYEKKDFSGAYEAWEKTLRDDYKDKATKELQDSLNGIKEFDTTFPIITKSKEERFVGAKGVIERDPDGKPVYMYGINWDKTKEVNTQIKLEEQRKIAEHNAKLANIGEMAAGVGHEINNPLSIVKGYIAILKKESNHNLEMLEKIEKATNRIEQIVSGLRQFVRSTEDDQESILITTLLETSVQMMSELFLKENIKLSYTNQNKSEDYRVTGNLGRIQQVIVNLITNARDAVLGQDDAHINITSSTSKNFVEIRIQDNGTGIAEDIRQRIFDPFFTTKEINKGTGIGLSLVFSIVNEHNGDISFESQEGIGTTFILKLPRSKKKEKPRKLKNASSSITHSDLKIMIVDDEADILAIIKNMLEEYQIQTSSFLNAQDAYEELIKTKVPYDIVITDMQMPQIDGKEFIKMIKENSDIVQPKIVISTGGICISVITIS